VPAATFASSSLDSSGSGTAAFFGASSLS